MSVITCVLSFDFGYILRLEGTPASMLVDFCGGISLRWLSERSVSPSRLENRRANLNT